MWYPGSGVVLVLDILPRVCMCARVCVCVCKALRWFYNNIVIYNTAACRFTTDNSAHHYTTETFVHRLTTENVGYRSTTRHIAYRFTTNILAIVLLHVVK